MTTLDSLRRRERVEYLAQRIGRIGSPLELVAVLAPVGRGLWKYRIEKNRLIAVTQRVESGDWRLVFTHVTKRETGEVKRGEYRRLLDERDREYYLQEVERRNSDLVALLPSHSEVKNARTARARNPQTLSCWFSPTGQSSTAEVVILGREDWTRGLVPGGRLPTELVRLALRQPHSVGKLGQVELENTELSWLELPSGPFAANRALLLLSTRPKSLAKRRSAYHEDVRKLQEHLASVAGNGHSFDGSRLRGLAEWIYSIDHGHPLDELERGRIAFDPSLLLELDDEQNSFLRNALGNDPPLFLTGRAGSSKSTLLHHAFARYCVFASSLGTEGEPRFVTRSSRLLSEARIRVRVALQTRHHISGSDAGFVRKVDQWMSTLDDHFRARIPPEALAGFAPDRYVGFDRFQRLYNAASSGEIADEGQWAFRDHRTRRDMSAATAWFIIRALIKGFDPARDPGREETAFEPDDYADLPRGDDWVDIETFKLVWEQVYLAWYLPMMAERSLWDDQDLARAVLDAGRSDANVPVTAIVCDEAQDLTRVEILALCSTSELLRLDLTHLQGRSLPIVLAGDEVQTLHPTAFRWETVTSAFYDLTRSAFGGVAAQKFSEKDLILNYRSVPEIVTVANAVQGLRQSRLDESGAFEQTSRLAPTGAPAVAFAISDDVDWAELQSALLTNTVLVPCDEGMERDYVRCDPLLRNAYGKMYGDWIAGDSDASPPIYGPHEAKGLEFRSVVLYSWGDWVPRPDSLGGEQQRHDPRLKYAKLYTALTRATHRLAFIERSDQALALWQDIASADTRPTVDSPLIEFRSETLVGELAQDAQEFAFELAQRGRRVESFSEMRRAQAWYAAIGMETEARRCSADGLRFDEQFLAAADVYQELSELDHACDCLWQAEAFGRLIIMPKGTARSNLLRSAAKTLTNEQPGIETLEELALTLAELKRLDASEGADPVSDRALLRLVDESHRALLGGNPWPCTDLLPRLSAAPLVERAQLLSHDSPIVGAIRWCGGGRADTSDILASLQATYPVTSVRQAVLGWLVLGTPEDDSARQSELLEAVYAVNEQDALVVELQSLRRSAPTSPRAGSLVAGSLDRLATSIGSLMHLVDGRSTRGN